MSPWPVDYKSWTGTGEWPFAWENRGPRLEPKQPRCAACGRYLKGSAGVGFSDEVWRDLDRHLDNECPVGGYGLGDGRHRRRDGTIREAKP